MKISFLNCVDGGNSNLFADMFYAIKNLEDDKNITIGELKEALRETAIKQAYEIALVIGDNKQEAQEAKKKQQKLLS